MNLMPLELLALCKETSDFGSETDTPPGGQPASGPTKGIKFDFVFNAILPIRQNVNRVRLWPLFVDAETISEVLVEGPVHRKLAELLGGS